MWYGKNLKIDEIADRVSKKDFSKTAERLMKYKIIEHCKLHYIEYKNLQRIEAKLHIPRKQMLAKRAKNK